MSVKQQTPMPVSDEDAGIVAFNAKTGKVEWTATEDAASYSSPAAAIIAGQRYAVFLTRAGLVGLDPASGAVKFQRAWRARANASVMSTRASASVMSTHQVASRGTHGRTSFVGRVPR